MAGKARYGGKRNGAKALLYFVFFISRLTAAGKMYENNLKYRLLFFNHLIPAINDLFIKPSKSCGIDVQWLALAITRPLKLVNVFEMKFIATLHQNFNCFGRHFEHGAHLLQRSELISSLPSTNEIFSGSNCCPIPVPGFVAWCSAFHWDVLRFSHVGLGKKQWYTACRKTVSRDRFLIS